MSGHASCLRRLPIEDLGGDVACHGAADGSPQHLGQDVADGTEEGHLAGDGQAQGHRGVDVGPRDAWLDERRERG